MDSSVQSSSQGSKLRALLNQLDASGDSDQAFVDLMLSSAERKDTELPGILRACAIPRRFNAHIIGVLRGDTADVERNQQLLDLLREYHFVLHRENGEFVYHNSTRDALLLDWRSTDEKRTEFEGLNVRLAEHYESIYADAEQVSRDLNKVAPVIQAANLDRYRHLAALVEARLAGPLLEGLYHRLMADPAGAIPIVEHPFFRLEETGLFHLCRSLIRVTRDFLSRLPSDQQDLRQFAWLDYFDNRIQRQLPPYDSEEIENDLRELSDRDHLDPRLQIWVLDALAAVYEREMRLDLAVKTRSRLLAQVSQSDCDDVFNEPLHYSNLGRLYWILDEHQQAIELFRASIELSRDKPGARRDLQVTAGTQLSGVYAEIGRWDDAFEAAIEALYLARTEFARTASVNHTVAWRMMHLLSTFDPALTDTVAQECMALIPGSSPLRLDARRDYINALCNCGRITTAEHQLKLLERETERSDHKAGFTNELLMAKAIALGKRGRRAGADRILSDLVDRTQDSRADRAIFCMALSRRALGRTKAGSQRSPEEDLLATIEHWTASGFTYASASYRAVLANVLGERGRASESREYLDQSARVLHGTSSSYLDDYYWAQAQFFKREARWQEVRMALDAGLAFCRERRDGPGQLRMLREHITVALEQSNWKAAERFFRDVVDVSASLAALDRHQRTTLEREADKLSADAMCVFASDEQLAFEKEQAIESLRSACERAPDNCWYSLNLSFVYAEQEEWQEAIASLAYALERCPKLMRTARLYRCWREYARNHAKELHRRGAPLDAAEFLGQTIQELDQHLPAVELHELRVERGDYFILAGRHIEADAAYADLSGNIASTGEQVVARIRDRIGGVAEYWRADQTLRQWIKNAGSDARRTEIEEAHGLLSTYLDTVFGLRSTPATLSDELDEPESPIVKPLVLEVGDQVVPIVDPNQDDGHFLYTLIPAMRQRILDTFGMSVPGVHARGTGFNTTDYTIQIDEVPRFSGSIHPAKVFITTDDVPSSTDSSNDSLTAFHPLTRAQGRWVEQQEADRFTTEDSQPISPAQFLVFQVEAILRQNLDRFFGIDAAAHLLTTWQAAPGGAELIADVLPSSHARLRMTSLLRALLRESVPISDWRSVVEGIRDGGGIIAPPDDILRAIRLRLREQLPGNRAGVSRISIPDAYQQFHRDADGQVVLTVSPEQKHEFTRWLRESVTLNDDAVVLVVGNGAVRPILSQWVRVEFPTLAVLSDEELIDR